jgi:hypothetical protein
MDQNDKNNKEQWQENKQWEENDMARLIQAGIGGDARLDPAVKERVWLRLAAQMPKQPVLAPFPDFAIGTLGVLLVLAAVGALVRYLGTSAPSMLPSMSPSLFFIPLFFLILNFAMIPVASILIVIRRRSHV